MISSVEIRIKMKDKCTRSQNIVTIPMYPELQKKHERYNEEQIKRATQKMWLQRQQSKLTEEDMKYKFTDDCYINAQSFTIPFDETKKYFGGISKINKLTGIDTELHSMCDIYKDLICPKFSNRQIQAICI